MKTFDNKFNKGVYASHVAKHVNATPQETQVEMINMYNEGLVQIQYELTCSNCARTVDTAIDISTFKQEYNCLCGEEIEDINPNLMLIRFINAVTQKTVKE